MQIVNQEGSGQQSRLHVNIYREHYKYKILTQTLFLTDVRGKVHTEPVRLGENLLQHSVPLLADGPDLPAAGGVHDPEENVPAGAASAAESLAAAQ